MDFKKRRIARNIVKSHKGDDSVGYKIPASARQDVLADTAPLVRERKAYLNVSKAPRCVAVNGDGTRCKKRTIKNSMACADHCKMLPKKKY